MAGQACWRELRHLASSAVSALRDRRLVWSMAAAAAFVVLSGRPAYALTDPLAGTLHPGTQQPNARGLLLHGGLVGLLMYSVWPVPAGGHSHGAPESTGAAGHSFTD